MRGDNNELHFAVDDAPVNSMRAHSLPMEGKTVFFQYPHEDIEGHAGQATGNDADMSP